MTRQQNIIVKSYMSYSYLSGPVSSSGLTNNFLESRDSGRLFQSSYRDYATHGDPQATARMDVYRTVPARDVERDPIHDAFFSGKNMLHLKRIICEQITKRSEGKYVLTPEAQSDDVLLTVMQSIFKQHCGHTGEPDELAKLNYLVAIDMIPRTMTQISQYLTYVRDKSQLPLPLDQPMCVNSAGTRSNKSITSLFV